MKSLKGYYRLKTRMGLNVKTVKIRASKKRGEYERLNESRRAKRIMEAERQYRLE
jgi:hypothetical protein